jgi:hypothetical protein
MAMPIIYSAVRCFDPACGDSWIKFIEWSGLTQLREVVSIDGCLCPTFFRDLIPEDWDHNVQEDYKIHLFRDLEYVLSRISEHDRINVLALMREPTANDLASFHDPRFTFKGFDLIEIDGSISALINCGGFPESFSNAELSDCGLLTDHAKAISVQKRLRIHNPDEQHAHCDVWAVWQMKTAP